MTLFAKVRALTLGTANDLLDKVIDLNSPTMLRQYVRDLETAEGQLRTEAAVAAGGVRTLTREKSDLEHRIADKTLAIKTVLASAAPNKDAVSRAYASEVVSLQSQLKGKTEELTDQATTSSNLDAALAKLDAKHVEMLGNLRRLESLDRSTKAKEHASAALSNVASLASSGDGISVDDIAAKMRARADVADEKFSRAMDDPTFQEDPSHAADVDALLNSLK